MGTLSLKVRKINQVNPRTKAKSFVARAITNGKQSFEDICELAGLNTTMNVAELEAAGKLILQAAARELKNGKIVDLGPIGAIYPAVSGKWAEKAEDLQKSDLTLKVNYRPSDEIDAAIKGAKLAWASAEDEKKEQENGGENTTTDPDEGAGNGGNTGGDDDANLEG